MNIPFRNQQMADYASNFIGWKYIWGGNDAHAGGMDCSGLVLECLRSVGLWGNSDTTAQGILSDLTPKSSVQAIAQKGDILFFGQGATSISHVAIALNEWQMIEAGGGDSSSKRGMIRVRPIKWRKDCVAILRIN